jgi:hypothetical protein
VSELFMPAATSKNFPKVLSDQILKALWLCARAGIKKEDISSLLSKFRGNQVKAIAALGIAYNKESDISINIPKLDTFKPSYLLAIEQLDEAYQALHTYQGSTGLDDYISKDIEIRITSIKNSKHASNARRSKLSEDDIFEISNYFQKRDLKNSDNKKAIYIDAKSIFKSTLPDGSLEELTDYQLQKVIKSYKDQF